MHPAAAASRRPRPSPWRVLVFALAPIASLTGLVLLVRPVARRLVLNRTPSQPRGLYWLRAEPPAKGSVVALDPPSSIAGLVAQRHYLPPGYRLLKKVGAVAGDRVCTENAQYIVNGLLISAIPAFDSAGRPLPAPHRFCGVVPAGTAWLEGRGATSLDSRFFGPVAVATLTTAVPLWTTSFWR